MSPSSDRPTEKNDATKQAKPSSKDSLEDLPVTERDAQDTTKVKGGFSPVNGRKAL